MNSIQCYCESKCVLRYNDCLINTPLFHDIQRGAGCYYSDGIAAVGLLLGSVDPFLILVCEGTFEGFACTFRARLASRLFRILGLGL